jgi:heme-degrading monooxygenase HmoA
VPVVSITRLRLVSDEVLPAFGAAVQATVEQITAAEGFLKGRLLRDASGGFWTMTLWEDERALRAYRDAGAHRAAMPRLHDWAAEAALVRWTQDGAAFPSWDEAHRRLVTEGRLSPLRSPAPTQSLVAVARPGDDADARRQTIRARREETA